LSRPGKLRNLNSYKLSDTRPLWDQRCNDDDICEFADEDNVPMVGSVRQYVLTLAILKFSLEALLLPVSPLNLKSPKWCPYSCVMFLPIPELQSYV
jgi:hypothetical protein